MDEPEPKFFRRDSFIQDALGNALAGAQVFVCKQPADLNDFPPEPLADVFSDSDGEHPLQQPLISDAAGHVLYYVASGIYTEVFYFRGRLMKVLRDQAIGCVCESFTVEADGTQSDDSLFLYGGNNITLQTDTNAQGGLIVTINGAAGGGGTGIATQYSTGLWMAGGTMQGNIGQNNFRTGNLQLAAGSGIYFSNATYSTGASPGLALTIRAQPPILFGGDNISIASTLTTGGIPVYSLSAGGGGGGAASWLMALGQAGGSTQGSSLVAVDPFLTLFAGSNVTLSASQQQAGYGAVTINAAAGGGGGGISSFQLSAGNTNLTVSQNNGSVATVYGPRNSWSYSAMNDDITVSMVTNSIGTTAQFWGAEGSGGGSGETMSGVSLVQSIGAGITSGTIGTNSVFTISAPNTSQLISWSNWMQSSAAWNAAAGGEPPPTFSGGANGQIATNQLMLSQGPLMSLQTASGPGGLSVTFSASNQTSAYSSIVTSLISSYATSLTTLTSGISSYITSVVHTMTELGGGAWSGQGMNAYITVNQATGPGGTTASFWGAPPGDSGAPAGGFTAGINGQLVTNQLMLSQGANISLQTSSGTSGLSATISALNQTSAYSSVVTSFITSHATSLTTLTSGISSYISSIVNTMTSEMTGTALGGRVSLVSAIGASIASVANTGGSTFTISAPATSQLVSWGNWTASSAAWNAAAGGSALGVSLIQSVGVGITSGQNASNSLFTISAPNTTQLTSWSGWLNSSSSWNTAGNWSASSAAWNAAAGGSTLGVSLIQSGGALITSGQNASNSLFTISAPYTSQLTSWSGWLNSSANWNTAGNWSASSSAWNAQSTMGSWTASSGNWNTANNWTASSGAWNTAGNWVTQSSFWNAGGSASGGGGGGDSANRYLCEAGPIVKAYTTWSEMSPTAAFSCVVWPLNKMFPGHYTAAGMMSHMSFAANFSGAASVSGYVSMSLGFYSRTGSTLTRLSSSSTQYTISITAQSNLANYNYLKNLKIPITAQFDDRDYWAAFCLSTVGNWTSVCTPNAVVHEGMMSGVNAGELGAVTNSTNQRIPFWGCITNVNSLPPAVTASQIIGTSATMMRVPVMWMIGFTV